jgi:hypothetical protein
MHAQFTVTKKMSQQKRQRDNDEKGDLDREQKIQRLEKTKQELTDAQNEEYDIIQQELVKNLQDKLKIEYEATLASNSQRAFNQPDILQSISSFLPFGQRTEFMHLTNRVIHLLQQKTKYKEDESFVLINNKLKYEGTDKVLGTFNNLPVEYAQNVIYYGTTLWVYQKPPEYDLTEQDERVKSDAIDGSGLVLFEDGKYENDINRNPTHDRLEDNYDAHYRQAELIDFNREDRRNDDSYPNPIWFMDDSDIRKWKTDRRFLGKSRSAFQPVNVIKSMVELKTLDIDLRLEDGYTSKTVVYGRAQTISEVEEQKRQRSYHYRDRSIPKLKLDYNPIVIIGNKALEVKRMICMTEIGKLMDYTKDLGYDALFLSCITSPGYILEWEFDLPKSVTSLTVEFDNTIYSDYDDSETADKRPEDPWKIHRLPYPELDREISWQEYPRYEGVVLQKQKIKNTWENITTLYLYGGRVPSKVGEGWGEAWILLLKNTPKLEKLEIVDNGKSDRLIGVLFDSKITTGFKNMKSVSIKAMGATLSTAAESFKYTRSMKITIKDGKWGALADPLDMPNLQYLTVVVTSERFYRQKFHEVFTTLLYFASAHAPKLKLLRFAIVFKNTIDEMDKNGQVQNIPVCGHKFPFRIFGFKTDVEEVKSYGNSKDFETDGQEEDDTDDHMCNWGLTFEHPLWKIYMPDISEDYDKEEPDNRTINTNPARGPVNAQDEEDDDEMED